MVPTFSVEKILVMCRLKLFKLTEEKVFATNPRCSSYNKIFLSVKWFHWIIVINKECFIPLRYIGTIIIWVLYFLGLKKYKNVTDLNIFRTTILFDKVFWRWEKRQFSSTRWSPHFWNQLQKSPMQNDNIKHHWMFQG